MRVNVLRLTVLTGFLLSSTAAANADVCVVIDSASDSLPASDQKAAQLLVARQFESNGEHVVDTGCQASYSVTHAQLGTTILVRMAGNGRTWEAVATGVDDLPCGLQPDGPLNCDGTSAGGTERRRSYERHGGAVGGAARAHRFDLVRPPGVWRPER